MNLDIFLKRSGLLILIVTHSIIDNTRNVPEIGPTVGPGRRWQPAKRGCGHSMDTLELPNVWQERLDEPGSQEDDPTLPSPGHAGDALLLPALNTPGLL